MASSPDPPPRRTATKVIDQAIAENYGGLRLCYTFAGIMVISGVGALAWGAYQGHGGVAFAGSVASALVWPAMHYARDIRETNIAIRLLEVPLSSAKTGDAAAKALMQAFERIFAQKRKG
jgi:hypothetical protein